MQLKSMRTFLSILLVVSSLHSFSQNQIFGKAKNWRLYKVEGNKAFNCPVDSLKAMESILLDIDSVNIFLKSAISWPKEKYSLWMGSWLASFEDENGNLHKIDISMYGGFFYDELLKIYYQVSEEHKKEWLQFINYNYEGFSSL